LIVPFEQQSGEISENCLASLIWPAFGLETDTIDQVGHLEWNPPAKSQLCNVSALSEPRDSARCLQ